MDNVFYDRFIATLLGIDSKSDKDILEFLYLKLLFIYVFI